MFSLASQPASTLHIFTQYHQPTFNSVSTHHHLQAKHKQFGNLTSMTTEGAITLQRDVPWRETSGVRTIPKIHLSPALRVPQNPHSDYALSIIKDMDPIGKGLAVDAVVESAGPECIVPGQAVPVKLLGLKVWPVGVDLKFLEPVGRELKTVGRILDMAMDLASYSR